MKNSTISLAVLSLILMLSCEKKSYKTIDFNSFKITIPADWKKITLKGIDSSIGGIITNKNDTITFDLGRYSGDFTKNPFLLVYDTTEYAALSNKNKEKLKTIKHLVIDDYSTANYDPRDYLMNKFNWDSIDCFRAKFIVPTNTEFGYSGIYIDSLAYRNGKNTRFSFYGNHLSSETQKEFFTALKTIKFHNYCNL